MIWTDDYQPTHLHLKSGKVVRVVQRDDPQGIRLRIEATWEPAVRYQEGDGSECVRPVAEFDDGRFIDFKPVRKGSFLR